MKKAIVNRLKVARKKVSAKWYNYSWQKAVILSDDTLTISDKKSRINKLIKGTRKNISYDYESYRSEKYSLITTGSLSPYDGWRISKTHTTPSTIQKTYHTSKDYDTDRLDDLFENIFREPGVLGIALVFKIQDKNEKGVIHYVSEYITKGLFDRIHEKDVNIYDHLSEKILKMNTKSTQEYELLEYYIRIIYAKSKTDKK